MPLLEQRLTEVRRLRARTGVVDTAVIAVTAAITATLAVSPGIVTTVTTAVFALTWAAALVVLRARAHRHGTGRRLELMPIAHSAVIAVAALAVAAVAAGGDIAAPHLYATLPVAAAGLLTVRAVRRAWFIRRTDADALAPRTLVVGDEDGIAELIRSLSTDNEIGHRIVGAALRGSDAGTISVGAQSYPVLGTPEQVAEIARQCCIETVVVAGGTDDPDYLRKLSWSLEGAATDLVLATRLADVARSRIAFERSNGLALTHVSLPRFDRSSMRAKRALDVVVALAALVPIALITPVIALMIAVDTPGGVFFRQRRIGRGGREFDILKFRTMTATAEADRAALEAANEGSGPLFKLKHDPRVTRVGAVLRRFSLDELPQFWNVLMGEMSVVGPRPPLPKEVTEYDGPVFRRLYVQPGITGLWQVSGRSDLSWEQSVRLDLHYVENWSLATDLQIIARTAAVMVRPKGAY
ncbi:exopolysaccharide biosynthesis polyprenyl glycosylphosphotransferase [Microbacterium telephonicum]|uniref:Exopolysaccharide biosynthesis polyprenyl glycosylphosphotransferase n=2 Tax=Microbacterium telephonicum TaxID=1714841 RepID=A0A498C0F2_9MICO|nr:exopolysaccharide biosynthesis polyprenyl glycosylphosphotransferase [Microbacterium telephonicum]